MEVNVDIKNIQLQIKILKESLHSVNVLYKELNGKFQDMQSWNDAKSQEAKAIVASCGKDIQKMGKSINEVIVRLEKILQPLMEYESVNLYSNTHIDTGVSSSNTESDARRTGIMGLIQSALRGNSLSERKFGDGLSVVRDTTNRDRFYVVGNNTDRFMNYWENASEYTEVTNDNHSHVIYVRASDIEGIYLSRREVDDLSGFWGRRTGGTQETFVEIANQVSQVRECLDAGLSYSDIREVHPELSDCVGIYFEGAPDVCSLDDFYVFNSNGRHRIMAASSVDAIIPVRVRGQYVRRDSL